MNTRTTAKLAKALWVHRLMVAGTVWTLAAASLAGAEPAESPVPGPATETARTLDATDFAGTLLDRGRELPAVKPVDPPTTLSDLDTAEAELAEYDPWAGFNEKTFAFNHGFDTYVLKPVARAYGKVVPNVVQGAVRNVFDNVGAFRRIINMTLQGRWDDSGQELGRFVINTVFGFGGFIDAAPSFGVADRKEADTGQTFGVWGADPGPYVVLPLLPSFTVRDGVGFLFDAAMNPINWVAPFAATVSLETERQVNDRTLNLELYTNAEESVFDLYAAVRNGYLQTRQGLIREGRSSSGLARRPQLILSGDK